MSISSLFLVKDIYGVFTITTMPDVNIITISQAASYTVIHETMDLNGTTYTEYSRSTGTGLIGDTVSPNVLTLTGFDSPAVQTVTLDTFANTVITYRYPRKQYTLTINNSGLVTTSTPSGTYYYGQQIHLVADATDGNGNSFTKWSDNTTNRDYTFTLTGNKTIEPIYASGYIITYQPNNGDSPIVDIVGQNQPLGTLPTVTNDDCVGSTGDYHTRGCTYFYRFEGWYTEPGFVNRVDASFVPTGDMTLYAKWNKLYFENAGPFTCTGSNYIDTDMQLFNQLNADKDFVIKFTVDQNNGFTSSSGDRGAIFADMSEVGEPFPGITFFTYNNTSYTMNINVQGHKVKDANTGYVTGQSVEIKKELGKVYYSYNGGTPVQINDFSNFHNYFNNKATFCAGTDKNGAIYRYFKGTLSGMSVELKDFPSYTIHYDANGGAGTMANQKINLGQTPTLDANLFSMAGHSFGGWNTAPDGTGTSYPDLYQITSDLGQDGDYITLYAQWIAPEHFYVHFDANGGTGTMNDQEFTISDPAVPLTQNAFTRTGYVFRGWNTAADGSGTHYDDEEAVRDLSIIDNDVVTLYADWWKIEYNHPGDAVFDGTANTFIDTGVNIFSSTNINKDFEIRFTFKSVDSDIFQVSPTQPTMFNAKDESNNKYPGFNVRFDGNINTINPSYRWGGNTVKVPTSGIATSHVPIEFVYKRQNGVITMQYSYQGFTSQVYTTINQSSWTLNQPFATNVAFGGFFDSNNQPGRFFKGTLADMIIIMDE
jgi:uncharacterized repeat protein (TIGR02543 family)